MFFTVPNSLTVEANSGSPGLEDSDKFVPLPVLEVSEVHKLPQSPAPVTHEALQLPSDPLQVPLCPFLHSRIAEEFEEHICSMPHRKLPVRGHGEEQ